MGKAKVFAEGDSVEIIRDTEHGRGWEPGRYVRAAGIDLPGWHDVRVGVDVFVVPARRIRRPEADDG